AVASVGSPPLAVVNAIVIMITSLLYGHDAGVMVVLDALGVIMVAYSVAATRETVAAGRRRLGVEWQARKALNFVDEFENSGRGWVWETDPLGTPSYVSRQLAEDFHCEPDALLGRQFTDPLSVHQSSDSTEE